MKLAEILNPQQMSSAAFKRWFKNSKVVDSSGQPKVVYHGTRSDFESFSKEKMKFGLVGDGAYFSDTPHVTAALYSNNENGNIVPVYLSIQKPFIHSGHGGDIPQNWEKLGYDGVIWHKEKETWYVVSDPAKIKSAIGNNGKFSTKKSSIVE